MGTSEPVQITGKIVSVEVDKGIKSTGPLQRPEELRGTTYKVKTPLSGHALFVTINDYEHEGKLRPFEIFINSKNMEHFQWIVALTRVLSAVFRHTSNVDFLVEELMSVYDPRGGHVTKDGYIPSLVAEIGKVLQAHLKKLGLTEDDDEPINEAKGMPTSKQCPECGMPGLREQEGCESCPSCDYTRCN